MKDQSHISREGLRAVLSIARTGFGYDTTTKLAAARSWELTEGGSDLGYVRLNIEILRGEEPRSLVVEFGKDDGPHFGFLPLYRFEDLEKENPESGAAFASASRDLEAILGAPSDSGEYGCSHRTWRYSYCWWSLRDAELVLVQDEFDIQDGFDITLWILPAGTPRRLPVRP
jgi:hypothetical protein